MFYYFRALVQNFKMWYHQDMNKFLKIITGMVLAVVVSFTALVYVCPMSFGGSMVVVSQSQSMCDAVGVAANQDGCTNSHLETLAKLLSDVPQIANQILLLILLALVSQFFAYKFLNKLASSFFVRYKHRYWHCIKFLIESKILKYLNFLGNYTVVSLS